jgi:hypothetical protein
MRGATGYPGCQISFALSARSTNRWSCSNCEILAFRPGYSVLPFHAIVFRGMLSGIEREALKIAASPQDMVSETSI